MSNKKKKKKTSTRNKSIVDILNEKTCPMYQTKVSIQYSEKKSKDKSKRKIDIIYRSIYDESKIVKVKTFKSTFIPDIFDSYDGVLLLSKLGFTRELTEKQLGYFGKLILTENHSQISTTDKELITAIISSFDYIEQFNEYIKEFVYTLFMSDASIGIEVVNGETYIRKNPSSKDMRKYFSKMKNNKCSITVTELGKKINLEFSRHFIDERKTIRNNTILDIQRVFLKAIISEFIGEDGVSNGSIFMYHEPKMMYSITDKKYNVTIIYAVMGKIEEKTLDLKVITVIDKYNAFVKDVHHQIDVSDDEEEEERFKDAHEKTIHNEFKKLGLSSVGVIKKSQRFEENKDTIFRT